MKERFTVKFAKTSAEKEAVYKLRYNDMILEYRPDAVNDSGLDRTPYDEYAKLVVCFDNETGEAVGSYRIITSDAMGDRDKFVTTEEFDINDILASGERIAELSRAVVKKEYRNSIVLMLMLRFIVKYLREGEYRYIIGEASFGGTDKHVLTREISYLTSRFPITDYNVVALEEDQISPVEVSLEEESSIQRSLPPLVRAYVAFGARVSSTTFTDYEFGSVDIFILLDSTKYNVTYIDKLLRINS